LHSRSEVSIDYLILQQKVITSGNNLCCATSVIVTLHMYKLYSNCIPRMDAVIKYIVAYDL